jgi:predicted ATPase
VAVNQLRDAGYFLYHTASLAELSDALGRAGEIERALTMIDEALSQSSRNDERWWRAELLRIKAEILLRQPSSSAEALAEDHLQQSLECARQYEALAWKLRTASSLCRLRYRQGRIATGRELPAPVYVKFTEGLHAADLSSARALLESDLPLHF